MTVHNAAVVDTNITAALRLYDPSELPDTILITAVTLGELSFGPHATDDPAKRAGRIAVLHTVSCTGVSAPELEASMLLGSHGRPLFTVANGPAILVCASRMTSASHPPASPIRA